MPATPGRAAPSRDADLAEAVSRWHDDGDIEPLARYVAGHPDEDTGVWREVVALHRYEACGESSTEMHGLRTIAHEFPDTVGGRIAAVRLFGDRLTRLRSEIPGPLVVDLLGGGDAWTRDESGVTQISAVDAERVRSEYAAELRDQLGAALVAEGCDATMGYCTWWLHRDLAGAHDRAIATAAAKTWVRRGHPTWRGGEHARCAARCSKRCRDAATPLDDSCFAPCYATC